MSELFLLLLFLEVVGIGVVVVFVDVFFRKQRCAFTIVL